MTINDIISATGLSGRSIAIELGIPYRTFQSWMLAERQPPEYLIRLIAEHYHLEFPEKG